MHDSGMNPPDSSADRSAPQAGPARLLLIALAVVMVGVGLVPPLLAPDLPDPLATQWGFDGEVSSTMSSTTLWVLVAVFIVPAAAVMIVVAGAKKEARSGSRLWVAVVALVGAMMAATSAMTIMANNGRAEAADVPGPGLIELVVVIALPLVVAAAVAWAVAQLPEAAYVPAPARPLDVADDSVISWSRNLTVIWLLWLALVGGAVGIGLGLITSEPWLGIVLVLSILPAALLARIEVFADHRGLTVAYGPWAWPRTRIPLDWIKTVEAIDLNPTEWGGWGYRGSLKLLRQAAVVLRAGPGLRLELVDGRRFAVSIDDPETAAAVLARELSRA